MAMNTERIIDYYQTTALNAYDRWGGLTEAYHFGYFRNLPVNFFGKQPEEVYKQHMNSHRNMLKVAAKFINAKEGELVIDAGCGSGSMIPYLSERGAPRVLGINITPVHLQKAKQRIQEQGLTHSEVILGDFLEVPLGDESVNKILFFESLTHASNQEKVLKEARRLLKEKGQIIIIEPMLTTIRLLLDAETYFNVREIDRGMCLQVSSLPYLDLTLRRLGFVVETKDITPHVLPSMVLAAASAEAHNELSSEKVFRHRSATISYRDLAQKGSLQYMMLKATKING